MKYGRSEKHYLVSASCLRDTGPVSLRKIMNAASQKNTDISDICRFTAEEYQHELGIGASASKELARVSSPLERGEQMIDRLNCRGIEIIFDDCENYPTAFSENLGSEAPLLLFVAGCSGLLSEACIGVVGSRRPTNQASGAARSFSASMAGRGWNVVSGAAPGIDSCAHTGALSAGKTIILPPEGILRFKWPWRVTEPLDDNNWCMASQFPPNAGWETKHALIRNKMITALSSTVVALEPRDKGGTWHSSNMAVKMGKPLFVASNCSEREHLRGMQKLLRRGAKALDCRAMPSGEDFEAMLSELEPAEKFQQKKLFNKTK